MHPSPQAHCMEPPYAMTPRRERSRPPLAPPQHSSTGRERSIAIQLYSLPIRLSPPLHLSDACCYHIRSYAPSMILSGKPYRAPATSTSPMRAGYKSFSQHVWVASVSDVWRTSLSPFYIFMCAKEKLVCHINGCTHYGEPPLLTTALNTFIERHFPELNFNISDPSQDIQLQLDDAACQHSLYDLLGHGNKVYRSRLLATAEPNNGA